MQQQCDIFIVWGATHIFTSIHKLFFIIVDLTQYNISCCNVLHCSKNWLYCVCVYFFEHYTLHIVLLAVFTRNLKGSQSCITKNEHLKSQLTLQISYSTFTRYVFKKIKALLIYSGPTWYFKSKTSLIGPFSQWKQSWFFTWEPLYLLSIIKSVLEPSSPKFCFIPDGFINW